MGKKYNPEAEEYAVRLMNYQKNILETSQRLKQNHLLTEKTRKKLARMYDMTTRELNRLSYQKSDIPVILN